MGVVGSNILAGSSGAAEDYTIDQSLRFDDGDSAYLSWTPGSAGDRKTWTWSGWVKRGLQGSSQHLFDAYSDASNRTFINIDNSDLLGFKNVTGGSTDFHLQTTQVLRDSGAWYHILVKYDSTPGTPGSSNVALYINGEQVTALGTESYPSQNDETWVNNTVAHAIGRYGGGSAYFDGYLAEVYFIDGTALTPASFGETDADTNQWKPLDSDDVKDAVTFGTNGFYQKYSTPYGIESFTSTGANTWTCPTGVTSIELLVVAGGGGGGGESGSGGGGGGVVHDSAYSVTPGVTYDITVGAGGGEGGQWGHIIGANGANSVFNVNAEGSGSTITAIGGGSGAGRANNSGRDGGSGGCGDGSGADGTTTQETSGTATGGTITAYGEAAPGGVQGGGAGEQGDGSGKSFANFTSYGLSGVFGAGNGRTSGGGQNSAADGAANTGNAGEGSNTGGSSGYGGNGGTGVVLIAVDAGLGADSSGNGNNFAVTNLVATDQVLDSPTNNFATLNPIANGYNDFAGGGTVTFSEGNLKNHNTAGAAYWPATMELPTTGKWYWECYGDTTSGQYGLQMSGLERDLAAGSKQYLWTSSGVEYPKGTVVDSTTYTSGDILGFAVNLDDGEIKFYKNNSLVYTGTNMNSLGYDYLRPCFHHTDNTTVYVNFGQDSSFAGTVTAQGNGPDGTDFYYEPPTDHLALCSSNLPSPEIALPTAHFSTKLYTGDGATTLAVTGVGFQPDFTWIKNRDQADNHTLVDSVRGATNYIVSNDTDIEVDDSTFVASLDSDGFTVGDDVVVNTSTENYASWNWLAGGTAVSNTDGSITSSVSANTAAGFSIVSYTGNSTAGATVGHGLSQAPDLTFAKELTYADNWVGFAEPLGNTKALFLDQSNAAGTHTTYWNDTSPSSTVITLGTDGKANSSRPHIMYAFHSIPGYSKVGSYEGNGDADGTFIYTGFSPAWVFLKRSNAVHNWYMFDNKRDTYNAVDANLQANDTAVEDDGPVDIDFISNGIKLRDDGDATNNSGGSYIYLAFAESPFKYSNAR